MSAAATRVLVLHGYSQNANIFSKRLGALRKQCGKNVDFFFLDAPHILQPVDLVGLSSNSNPQATLEALDSAAEPDPTLAPRAWWKVNEDRTVAYGLEETLELLRDVLKEQKFNGVFGFSQGAALAAMLSALLERPHVVPSFLVDGQSPHPPFDFCVAISGFRLRDPLADTIFADGYSTPTLHVIGKTDVIVVEERSRLLVGISTQPRVEEHEGGHFVPSKGNWRKFLADYLRDPASSDLVPSPNSFTGVPSGPNSGAATPVGPTSGGTVLMMKL